MLTVELPAALAARMASENTLVVLNKADLPSVPRAPLPFPIVNLSTLQGTGLEALKSPLLHGCHG